MKKWIGVLTISALVLSGCASTVPDWVGDGTSKDYPAVQFLTATADGDTRESAAERARIELEKEFRPRFDHDYLKTLSLGNIVIDGKQQNLHAKRASDMIHDRLGSLMNGIRIAETWSNIKTSKFHALAVLPRAQAAAKLNEELYNLDRATQSFLREAKRKTDTLEKIQYTSHAIDTQVARRSLTRTLQTIDRKGKATAPRWRLGSLSTSLDGLLLRVRVSQQVAEDPTGKLDKALVDALSLAGFYIDSSKRPEFVMRGSLELSDGGERDGWKWKSGVVEIRLMESRTSRNRGKIRWSIQAAGKTEQQATQRIIAKVDSLLKAEMRGTIVKFATN
jgi:hypothetical protein